MGKTTSGEFLRGCAAVCDKASMELDRKKILVVSDSRGSKLGSHLEEKADDLLTFDLLVKRGGDLLNLWNIAEQQLRKGKADMVFLYGGVCNLTDLFYNVQGQRMAWPPTNLTKRMNDISSIMENIADEFKTRYHGKFLSFIPEAGLDLVAYNRIPEPVQRQYIKTQEELERLLPNLHVKARYLNDLLGSATAWSLDATHTKRGPHMIPVYTRLQDGLHPSDNVAKKIANAICKAARKTVILHT